MYDEDMPVDPESLRHAMRRWTTGVTIVSAAFRDLRNGMTVSSFTSVSLDPPLVLVSLDRDTLTHQLVEQSGSFAVSILSREQEHISDLFAGRIDFEGDRFDNLETFTLATGAPMLAGCLAAFDCRVVSDYLAGTRTVFIGEVLATFSGAENPPLLYYNQDYHSLLE
jgi:flavin reductase (DIM6/NTAB) family NADH-FMN oxidoreductase RutF